MFRVAHVLHFFSLTVQKLLVSAYGFCRPLTKQILFSAGLSLTFRGYEGAVLCILSYYFLWFTGLSLRFQVAGYSKYYK